MEKQTIQIEIDPAMLRKYPDVFLMTAWHVAQQNPAPFGDYFADGLVQAIGWEIIRRWLSKVEPEMYHHQAGHNAKRELTRFAKYVPAGDAFTDDFHRGEWVLKPECADCRGTGRQRDDSPCADCKGSGRAAVNGSPA